MGIGKKLKEAREKAGLTQEELARKVGVTGSAITNYEKETSHPKEPVMYALMEVLGVEPNFLFQDCVSSLKLVEKERFSKEEIEHIKKYRLLAPEWKEAVDGILDIGYRQNKEKAVRTVLQERRKRSESVEKIEANVSNFIKLRFSELKASAGTGYQLDDDQTTTWKVLYNKFTRMADFCLEVDGQSMEPKICDGDIILIRQQPSVEIGEIGLFTVNDTGYVKKQGKDCLISINRAFPDVFPNKYDTVFCRGKVIGVLDPEWIIER